MRMSRPRLLPLTICVLALSLAVKSVELVEAVTGAGQSIKTSVLASAQAASPESVHPASPPKTPAGKDAGAPAAISKEKMEAVAGKEGASISPPVDTKPPPPQDPPISDSERTLLLELRQRREQLEAREAGLATREAVLTATERKLSGRVTELQALQKNLEALEASRVQREESGWQGLVKLYETMKPRDAATILNELDMKILLQVLDRMKEGKAALILSALHPEKAREVTDGLARLRVHDLAAAPNRQ